MRTRVLFSIVAVTALCAGCGGGDDDGSAPNETFTEQAPEPTDQAASPPATAVSVEPEIRLTVDGTTFEDFEIQTCSQFFDDDPLEVVAFSGEGDGSWSIASTASTQPGGAPRAIVIRAGNSGDPTQLPDFFDQLGQASVKQEFTALADEFSLTTVDDVATLEGTGISFANEGDHALTISADLTIIC